MGDAHDAPVSGVAAFATEGRSQYRLQWLDALEAAAAEVTHSCLDMRAGMAAGQPLPALPVTKEDAGAAAEAACALVATAAEVSGSSMHEAASTSDLQEQQLEAQLRQAAEKLHQLLDGSAAHKWIVGVAAGLPPAAPSTSGRAALPTTIHSTSRLLALPHQLLSHVVRSAGQDARLVCRQLRDAYGCPGTVIRQPVPEHTVSFKRAANILGALQEQSAYRLVTSKPVQLAMLQICQPPREVWDVLRQLAVRSWGAQVTRLELSSDFSPDLELMRAVQRALPNLRELQCAWWDFRGGITGALAPVNRVPLLASLKGLTTLCSLPFTAVLVGTWTQDCSPGFSCAQLLPLAPSLQSLSLDLQWQQWGQQLTELSRLSHLTHLSVNCLHGSSASIDDDMLQLLSSLAGSLKSFALRSSCLKLGTVLQTMSRLTSLELCDDYVQQGTLPAHWALLPHLRQLHLGCFKDGWQRWMARLNAPHSAAALHASLKAGLPHALADVILPLASLRDDTRPQLQDVLTALQARCTGLTSLAVGCAAQGSKRSMPQPQSVTWLGSVAGMLHLQRLALVLPMADIALLAHLGGLPSLSTLWLHLQCTDLQHPGWGAMQSAAAAMGALGSVSDMTLVLELVEDDDDVVGGRKPSGGASASKQDDSQEPCIVAALLTAAARMPRLEVLDTLGLVACSSSCRPWEAFAASPPPCLRLLLLRADSTVSSVAGQELRVSLEDATAAAAHALPSGVAVCCEARAYFRDKQDETTGDIVLARGEVLPQVWSLQRPARDACGRWSHGALGGARCMAGRGNEVTKGLSVRDATFADVLVRLAGTLCDSSEPDSWENESDGMAVGVDGDSEEEGEDEEYEW